MPGSQGETPLDRADRAAELAQAAPPEAMRMARAVTDLPGVDAETLATATWAMGLAARELGALDEANEHLTAAIGIADTAGLPARAARARLSHALVLVYLGDTEGALAALDRARPDLGGVEQAWCDVQHALVMTRLGRLDEALEDSLRALPLLRAGGDRLAEARLLANLGVLRVYRGELADAVRHLEAARALASELGQALLHARALHNLAFVHGRLGDVPKALALFDEAEEAYAQAADPDPDLAVLAADRAELLLAAGLHSEAEARAEDSLAALRRTGNVTDQAEVLLLVARCRLATGDRAGAVEAARAAAAAFAVQERRSWVALAEHIALEATDEPDLVTLAASAQEVADRLTAAGWRAEALRASGLAGRTLLAAGETDRGVAVLEAAGARRRRGTAAERVSAWQATALHRVATGDRSGARRAVAAGLRVIDDHRASLGASELRAHASAAGAALAEIGMRLAIGDRRPRELLRWVESLRAISVLTPTARPPDDQELAAELTRLRAAQAELRTGVDAASHAARAGAVSHLEAAIARRTRRAAGSSVVPTVDLDEVFDRLGDRALIELVVLDRQLLAIVVAGRRVTFRCLGEGLHIQDEAASALFSLHRLARDHGSDASRVAARDTLEHALAALSRALVEPLGRLGDGPVVVVPPGPLRRLPWGSLTALAGRPTTVAPSAAAWARAAGADAPMNTVLLVAGPDLPGAEAEIAELTDVVPDAVVLTPPASTAAAVVAALDGGTAHIAAHGTFRSDNPLFSALLLADGPLTVYDLAAARCVPRWFVLSACDAAVSTAPGGDEILGLGAELLALGTTSLIAPIAPVADEATRPLMVRLHRGLRAGASPSVALAAIVGTPEPDPMARAAQVAFAALGA